MTYHGKRRSGPWYRDARERLQFEWGVKRLVPSLRQRMTAQGLTYTFTANVPYYEDREVTIFFRSGSERPVVTVDGPTDSPHRFLPSGSLCMWYDHDDESRKWVRTDKLLALMGHIVRHLFKEAWWRETGEWLGPAISHGQKTDDLDGEQA
jgi:hypothetical protein